MIRLVEIRDVAATFLLTLFASACGGPTAEQSAEDDLDRAEREISDSLAPGKEDSPNSAIAIIGEIAPGSPVTADVSPAKPYVGWLFRTEADPDVRATAAPTTPPPSTTPPGALMVLYRRTSCLGPWQAVARGTQVLTKKLPGEGEYLLASGLRNPNVSATLQASFTADQTGKVVTADRVAARPYKLAEGWVPADAQSRLAAMGLHRFSDIAAKGSAAVAQKTGLSRTAVDELSKLAGWLDTDGVTYAQACALKRGGLNGPEDYYRLSMRDQKRFEPLVRAGTIPFNRCARNPDSCRTACVALEPPANDAVINPLPSIDWTYYSATAPCRDTSGNPVTCVIDNRPWTKSPQNRTADPRWYPDPNQGWDIVAYNFGRSGSGTDNSSARVGYIVAHNRYLSLMRLFVWIPRDSTSQYNELAVNMKVKDDVTQDEVGWIMPSTPYPAIDLCSSDPAFARGCAWGRQMTFVWRHQADIDFNSLAPGKWVRAEFLTLFDPQVYALNEPIKVMLNFDGITNASVNLYGNLQLEANGSGVSTHTAPSNGALDMLVRGGSQAISWGSAASKLGGNPYNIIAGGTAGLAGLFYGVFSGPDTPAPDVEKIALLGTVSGTLTGVSRAATPEAELYFWLSGTADPLAMQTPAGQQGGVPATQRCGSFRWGAMYFDPPPGRLAADTDPRPTAVQMVTNACTPSGTSYLAGGIDVNKQVQGLSLEIGKLAGFGPAQSTVSNRRIGLELVYDDPNRPGQKAVSAVQGQFAGTSAPWDTRASFPPLAVPYYLLGSPPHSPDRPYRVYLRWYATVTPPGQHTYEWNHALDITDRVPLDPQRYTLQDTMGPNGERGFLCLPGR